MSNEKLPTTTYTPYSGDWLLTKKTGDTYTDTIISNKSHVGARLNDYKNRYKSTIIYNRNLDLYPEQSEYYTAPMTPSEEEIKTKNEITTIFHTISRNKARGEGWYQ